MLRPNPFATHSRFAWHCESGSSTGQNHLYSPQRNSSESCADNQPFSAPVSERFMPQPRAARRAVRTLMPSFSVTVRQDVPESRRPTIYAGSASARGLPRRLPLARELASPERTRSRINSRSNSPIIVQRRRAPAAPEAASPVLAIQGRNPCVKGRCLGEVMLPPALTPSAADAVRGQPRKL